MNIHDHNSKGPKWKASLIFSKGGFVTIMLGPYMM